MRRLRGRTDPSTPRAGVQAPARGAVLRATRNRSVNHSFGHHDRLGRRHQLASSPNGRHGDALGLTLDSSAILRSLETDGIATLPKSLPEYAEDMTRFLSDKPVVLPNGERVHHERVPPGCTLADYQLETVLRCPHVLALANSDSLIRTATQYLGCLPTISTLRLWWSPGRGQKRPTTSIAIGTIGAV